LHIIKLSDEFQIVQKFKSVVCTCHKFITDHIIHNSSFDLHQDNNLPKQNMLCGCGWPGNMSLGWVVGDNHIISKIK
jgi:hypothetical protein